MQHRHPFFREQPAQTNRIEQAILGRRNRFPWALADRRPGWVGIWASAGTGQRFSGHGQGAKSTMRPCLREGS